MEELLQMGKEAGIKKLAEHDHAGTLLDYVSKIAPEYVESGSVLKSLLLDDLGWL